MAREAIIYIDKMLSQDREKCSGCSAQGTDYRVQIPFPLCKIARLEKIIGKKPKLGWIAAEKINIETVPDNCPNGY